MTDSRISYPDQRATSDATELLQAMTIELFRAEGPGLHANTATLTAPGPFSTKGGVWQQAQQQLVNWSFSAPKTGYHKVDFTVTYEDDQTYRGTFLLTSDGLCDLGAHVQARLDAMLSPGGGPGAPAAEQVREFQSTYQVG